MEMRGEAGKAAKAMVAILAVIIVAELLIMLSLSALGFDLNTPAATFLDALLLTIVVAPPIYWVVLTPIRREYDKRLEAEIEAQEMSRVAITDPLTHLMNRRGITVGLLDAMAQAERYRTPLIVAMADIDHFKEINDTHGHKAGDRVLREVTAIFTEVLRMPDKVGRYGGEEFLIIMPHTKLAQGRKIAERIRASVGKWEFDLGSKKIHLTISIGMTQFKPGDDLEKLVSLADKALYDAKQGGRNLVVAREMQ